MNEVEARVAFGAGLARLIPLPWVDDWAERRLLRRLCELVAERRGVALSEGALDDLTEDRSSMAVGCLLALVRWPIKKLFRTILFVLLIKDVIDAATRAAHIGSMVEVALDAGALPDRSAEVRTLIDKVLDRIRSSPVSRALLRQDRPELASPAGRDAGGRVLRWLQRHGGGAVVDTQFRARLAEIAEGEEPACSPASSSSPPAPSPEGPPPSRP